MSLQIVAGSSGAGKSYIVYRQLIEQSIAHPDRTFLVIVPEQFTMQTQKDLVLMHPRHGLLNVDVLSFNRLAWRVFEETGGGREPVLDDLGKSLMLQRIIARNKSALELLAGTLRRPGAVGQMKSLISELMQYRISPEELEEQAEEMTSSGGIFPRKLRDIAVIYREFLMELQDRFLTAEEVPERLCSVIGRSALVRNATIVFDGFTGFTPVQYQVIRELLQLAEAVTVIVTADSRTDLTKKSGPQRLFHMSVQMVRKLYENASGTACEILPVWRIEGDGTGRFRDNPPLRFLEKQLFRYRQNTYQEQQDAVRLLTAANPREELRWITSEIMHLVRVKGYRYRDFAVITGDQEHYGREAARQLEGAKIPYFLDQKQSVLANPLVEFLRAAADMVVRGFTYESVFRYLRSGMTDFSPDEIDRMENYCLGTGVRGWKQYQERWIRLPRHLKPEEIEPLNELRERFVSELTPFVEGMRARGSTLRERAEVLYRLMESMRLQQKTAHMEQRFEKAGEHAAAREYAQIYPLVIDMLDRMTEILGEDAISMTAFAQLLDAGFEELRIGLIPPGEDQVMIGDIERTRLKHIRVLFFAGVNEGIIPRTTGGEDLLSESDRSLLESRKVELAPKGRALMYQQRLYLYLAMTKPQDHLYLSYSETGADGSGLMPSYLIGLMRRLFPGTEPETVSGESILHRLESPEGLMETLTDGIRTPELMPEVTEALVEAMRGAAIPLLDAAAMHNPAEGLRKETVHALYGTTLVNSATRLERFAACAFAHFAQYGLGLTERDEYDFTPADMGTIMHNALERFSLLLQKRHLRWTELSDEKRRALVDEALDGLVHDYGNTILHSSQRYTYLIERIRRILYRTTWALEEQMRRSSFVPLKAEAAFRSSTPDAMHVRLSETEELRVQGRIDRIDICEGDDDGKMYVRVIDYKTGQTGLKLDRLYHGLQLQLPLYLNAALEVVQKEYPDRTAEAAGIYYYNIQDPLVESPDETEMLKELRMEGISREEDRILALLDHTTAGQGTAEVIQVSRTKGGALSKNSHVTGADGFDTIRQFTGEKIRALGRGMLDGEIKASPHTDGTYTACSWCPYRGVCGFDERIPGYRYRRLRTTRAEEAIDCMRDALKRTSADTAEAGEEMLHDDRGSRLPDEEQT